MRTVRLWLAGIMVASVVSVVSGTDPAVSIVAQGLGDYGPSGPITPENSGNPEISAETMAVAESDAFASIRASWDEQEDFVAQVGYQLAFRSSFDYLDSSPDHIAGVLTRRSEASALAFHELGLYLTESEWDEFARRRRALDNSRAVRAAIVGPEIQGAISREEPTSFGPFYGGRWQDQLNGGTVMIGLVSGHSFNTNSLRGLMERSTDVEFVEVKYSWDQLHSFATAASTAAKEQGIKHMVSAHAPVNKAIVTVADASYLPPKSVPEDALQVDVDPAGLELVKGHADFRSNHSVLQQSPGLKVYFDNSGIGYESGGCTWGLTGHTTSYNYLVAAGHCVVDGTATIAGFKDIEVWQNGTSGTRISNYPDPYVVAKDHTRTDSARVQAHVYADTNCYHTETSSCGFTMTSRRGLYDHAVGQTICAAYAESNDYLCPNIDQIWGSYFVDYRLEYGRINGKPKKGDSGSGIKFSKTWDGVHYAHNTTRDSGWFYPAYSVKVDLNFDFNCITSGSNPSGWGACPLGDPN